MSDSLQIPWSDNPYAPLIPDVLYKGEKYNFAGVLIAAMFYGTLPVHTHQYSRSPFLFGLPF
jgi:hypothetical protein